MTYPDDVLKAAREAAAEVADRLGKHGYRARYERGQFDNSIEVRAACIAIMAEREALLRRAESLIAKGKDLPFKPSFGMLVIEWMRQIQRKGM